MFSTLAIIAAATLLGAGFALAVLVHLITRAPDNDPRNHLRQARRSGARCVVCLGDSLTHASVSGDYVRMLEARLGDRGFEFVNAGVNGETTADVLHRLDSIVACRPDALTLLIGTNDCREGVDAAAPAHLADLFARLSRDTNARFAVLSIPPIGEALDSAVNARVNTYNAMLRGLAERCGAAYLPLHERLRPRIESAARRPSAREFNRAIALHAGLLHYFFRKSWDEIAEHNGLSVLTDHLHMNDSAARQAAELIEGWLVAE
ncbi:MAG TPA: GDSL-type esterase/lipase family protein [Polyangiales bacterium]|nr:GDSL-type esterase/lipase family protein [Polyangiales bacterium]